MKLPFNSKARKAKAAYKEAMAIIESMKKLVDLGAIKFDREKREVYILALVFWENKNEMWRRNFAENLKMFMDITNQEENFTPIHIYSIDIDTKKKAAYLTSYFPIEKIIKELETLKP